MRRRSLLFWTACAGAAAVVLAAAAVRLVHSPDHAAHEPARKPVYYCPMHPTYTSDRPGNCAICGLKLVKREEDAAGEPAAVCVTHNCPMAHNGRPCPMQVVSEPGEKVRCPVCGEQIVGAEAKTGPASPASPEGYAAVLLSPQKRQQIGVKTVPAERRAMVLKIRAVGRIAYDPELYRAEQEYLQARRAGLAQVADAARLRLKVLGLDDDFIGRMSSWEGPDQKLLLADPQGRVWVYVSLYEFELPYVKPGQVIRVGSSAIPGKLLEGKVESVDSVLDPATRTARARAILTDPDKILRPEMYVDATLEVPLGKRLAVPSEAVMDTGSRRILFVDRGQGLFEPREATVGVRADGWTEILSGVSEGEPVVTNGNFLVDSESRLKAALSGMGDGGEAHPHGS